jgi:hypothetical protein
MRIPDFSQLAIQHAHKKEGAKAIEKNSHQNPKYD